MTNMKNLILITVLIGILAYTVWYGLSLRQETPELNLDPNYEIPYQSEWTDLEGKG